MRELDVFQDAHCVKVNPDSPQKQVRFLTLSGQILDLGFVFVCGAEWGGECYL